MSVSGVTTNASVSTGNGQDVSSLFTGSVSLSLSEAVSTKVQPYLTRADTIATSINTNASQIAAYQNMQSLLTGLQDAASNLTNEALTGSNVFGNRIAALSSSNSAIGASSILSAAITAGTPTGTHTVEVKQLAAAEVDVSSTVPFGSTAALGYVGTFSLGELGSTAASIAVTSSMSLTDIASAINGYTGSSGVSASIVSVDASDSVLVISGANTDKQLSFSDTSGSVLQTLGVLNAGTLTGTTVETSNTTAVNLAGAFSVNGSGPVTVTTGMSLSDIAAAINSAVGSSVASVTGSGTSYQLQVTNASGPVTFSGISGSALSGLGLAASGAISQAYAPQAANLTVDGIPGIVRSTNSISDVLTGVTLNLAQAAAGTTVTVAIQPDVNGAGSAIQAFVNAYNTWESFVAANQATTSSGTAAASAVLFGDSTLRDASVQVGNALDALVNNQTLADIGITLSNSNTLQIDTTTLSTALTQSFSSVVGLFDAQVTASSPLLQQLGSDYSSFAGSFTLGITASGGTISGLTLNGAATSAFTFSGNSIYGAYGTAYSGLSFTYTGSASATIGVSGTQGVANQTYTTSNEFANTLTGTVQTVINNLQDENSTLTTNYNTIIADANSYTQFLLNQYSQLTSQIQSANQTTYVLQQLSAAQNSSNG